MIALLPSTIPFGSKRANRKASTNSSSGTPCCNPRETALAKQFKVDGYPTLIVLASDGKRLGEAEFDLFDATAKDVIAAIEKLAKKAKQ